MGIIADRIAVAAERSKPHPMGGRGWNGSAKIGTIYMLADPKDPNRIGNCWAQGRVFYGDYILCVDKAGDCFYNYVLLERAKYAYNEADHYTAVSREFGAYQIGDAVCALTDEQFTAILAGEKISVRFD